jgi:hypothetical protein
MRSIRGVDVASLGDQFNGYIPGRTLILDGDGPAYRVAATVKRLDTAVRNFQQEILKQLFMTQSSTAIVHFTASGSKKAGRFLVKAVKPYQGQRKNKDKPALLEPLREAMAHRKNWLPEFEVVLHREREADDGMIIDAYRLKEHGVIWSDDKDLQLTPYLYFRKELGVLEGNEPHGWLAEKYTPAGALKIIGRGTMFFWCQMLMGDSADNVGGIKKFNGALCGPAGAYKALQHCKTEHEAAQIVLDAYRRIDQNPLPEATLLWLLRHPSDSALQYIWNLALSAENAAFIQDCVGRDWYHQGEPIGTEETSP